MDAIIRKHISWKDIDQAWVRRLQRKRRIRRAAVTVAYTAIVAASFSAVLFYFAVL